MSAADKRFDQMTQEEQYRFFEQNLGDSLAWSRDHPQDVAHLTQEEEAAIAALRGAAPHTQEEDADLALAIQRSKEMAQERLPQQQEALEDLLAAAHLDESPIAASFNEDGTLNQIKARDWLVSQGIDINGSNDFTIEGLFLELAGADDYAI